MGVERVKKRIVYLVFVGGQAKVMGEFGLMSRGIYIHISI